MISDNDFEGSTFRHRESDLIELKEAINLKSNKYKETICAFLNSNKGGYLIFGIKNNLDIIGLRINDNTIDEFICIIDQIISNGLIMCWNILDHERKITKIAVNTIKTKVVINSRNKKFLIISVSPDVNTKYQLRDGSIFYRLNASNYYDKTEQIYKYSELCNAVKEAEKKVYVINSKNIEWFQKSLKDKDDEINKLKEQLANNEMYLINPLKSKLNEVMDNEQQSFIDYLCSFFF